MSGRRESRLEPVQRRMARISRVGPVLFALAAVVFALASAYAVPHAVVALEGLNDPARIADHALDGRFDAVVARHEIEAALAAHDADLAQSFVDLAADRSVAIESTHGQKVNDATEKAATTRHKAESFARGFITGEPDDMAALAGTTLGDLFVFGDIRDALREGKHLVAGEQADELVLGLACVGIAITAGTYATFGAAAPARVGLTLAKAARKTGPGNQPLRSFRDLLDHLATLTRDTIRIAGQPVDKLTPPTPDQRRAFDLIGAPSPLTLATT